MFRFGDNLGGGSFVLQTCALTRKCSPEVLNPTPLSPTPATCDKRKQKLRCNFQNIALQKLHCNIRFPAVRKSLLPEATLQQAKNCNATLKKAALQESGAFLPLSCGFQAHTFRLPCLGSADVLTPGETRICPKGWMLESPANVSCLKSEKGSCPSIFLPAILGPKMATPLLWASGFFGVLQEKTSMPIKFSFVGGGYGVLGFGFGGGGSAHFIFMGAGICLMKSSGGSPCEGHSPPREAPVFCGGSRGFFECSPVVVTLHSRR